MGLEQQSSKLFQINWRMEMNKTIGIIGLGPMGGIIATNLLKNNFSIVGYDLKLECRRELEVNGGTSVSSTTEVADKADVLIASLPGAQALDTVIDLSLIHI